MLLEVDTGVWYNTDYQPDQWYLQSPDCINLGNDTMNNYTPDSSVIETSTIDNVSTRLVSGVWVRTTATGTWRFEVKRHWKEGVDSKAFYAKKREDSVLVTAV